MFKFPEFILYRQRGNTAELIQKGFDEIFDTPRPEFESNHYKKYVRVSYFDYDN
jgi:hypothetical protein